MTSVQARRYPDRIRHCHRSSGPVAPLIRRLMGPLPCWASLQISRCHTRAESSARAKARSRRNSTSLDAVSTKSSSGSSADTSTYALAQLRFSVMHSQKQPVLASAAISFLDLPSPSAGYILAPENLNNDTISRSLHPPPESATQSSRHLMPRDCSRTRSKIPHDLPDCVHGSAHRLAFQRILTPVQAD